MIVLAMVDLRVWFALAYPVYGVGLLLLLAVAVVGHSHAGRASAGCDIGPMRLQPSEIMKIGLVLALARFYHGLSAEQARLSWWLLIPPALIARAGGAGGEAAGPRHRHADRCDRRR